MKKKENPTTGTNKSSVSGAVNLSPGLHDRIARKAYELFEKRGWAHGFDVHDWLEAERLVRAETKPEIKTGKSRSKAETESKRMTPSRESSVAAKPRSILGRP